MPHKGRRVKIQPAFITNPHRGPISAPNKPQPKVQVLARPLPTPPGAPNSTRSPSPVDSDYSEMGSSFGPADSRLPFSRRGRILDDNGPPRSAAPISLEDLVVKTKPGRQRGNRGGRTLGSLIAEDSQPPSDSLVVQDEPTYPEDSLLRSSSQAQLNESSPSHSASRLLHTEPPSAPVGLPFEDGDFQIKNLENGDISVCQWSEVRQAWSHLGQIGQSDVSLFTRFYDRAYAEHRSNATSWKLYKEHIVATVKQLSQKRRDTALPDHNPLRPLATNGLGSTPRSQEFHHGHEHLRTRHANSLSADTESFPPLPTRKRLEHDVGVSGNSTAGVMLHDTNHQAKSPSIIQRLPDSSSVFQYRTSQQIQGVPVQHDVSANELGGYNEYRDVERRRLQHSLILQSHRNSMLRQQQQQQQHQQQLLLQQQQQQKQQQRSSPKIPYSELDQLFRHSMLQGDMVPPLRSSSNSQDLRRTVLYDPLKAALSTMDRGNQNCNTITAIGHGAPCSSETPTPRIELTPGPKKSHDSLRNLVEASAPCPQPHPEADLSVRSDGNSKRGTSEESEPNEGVLRAHRAFQPPNRRLFSQDTKGLVSPMGHGEALEKFWMSGLKRQSDYERQAGRILGLKNKQSDVEADIGVSVMISVYESVRAYQFSATVRAAGGHDSFANFAPPPSWAVEPPGAAAGKPVSLFEKAGRVESREVGERSMNQGHAPLVGGSRSLGILGMGLRLPPLSSFGRPWQSLSGTQRELMLEDGAL